MSETPVSNTPATTSATTKVGNTTTNTPPEMLHGTAHNPNPLHPLSPSGNLDLRSDAAGNPILPNPNTGVSGTMAGTHPRMDGTVGSNDPNARVVGSGPGEPPVTNHVIALPSTLDLTRPFGARSSGVNEFQIIQDGKVIGGGTLPAHESAVITNWLNGLRQPR